MPVTNIANLAWGQRDSLFDKRFDYMFSLEVVFEVCVSPVVVGKATPLRAVKTTGEGWDTFHVRGEDFIRTPGGIQQQVPRARILYGSDSILIKDDAAVAVDGGFVFETDTPDRLSMRYKGVLKLAGGTQSLCARPPAKGSGRSGPSGSIQIASTQDVVNTKYRWMVVNQVIGIGRVEAVADERPADQRPNPKEPGWLLNVDYDFYIAS